MENLRYPEMVNVYVAKNGKCLRIRNSQHRRTPGMVSLLEPLMVNTSNVELVISRTLRNGKYFAIGPL